MANQKGITQQASKDAFIEAMYKTFGNVSASCRAIGICRDNPYEWAKTDPVFKAKFESTDYEEIYMDAIEGKLAKVGLQDENPTVLIFLAKTKAKKRGYVETQQFNHLNNGNSFNNLSDDELVARITKLLKAGKEAGA